MPTIDSHALAMVTGADVRFVPQRPQGNPLARQAVYRLVESVKAYAAGEAWARNGIIINMGAVKRLTGESVVRDKPWQLLNGRTLEQLLGWRAH